MADLEAAIATSTTVNTEEPSAPIIIEDSSESDFMIGEHIAANFSDGFYIGEILEKIDDETYKVSYMSPKTIATADAFEHPRRFWYWPSKKDQFDTDVSSILNLKPVISLATPPSTKRLYVFACHNAEILEVIANSVTEEI